MELHQYEKDHLEQLRRLLPECTVLLKSNGDFPLEQAGKLALYGSGARHTVKGGTGSGEVNSRCFINVEQGLTDAGFTVTTWEWLYAYDQIRVDAKKQFIKDIKARAKQKHTNAIVEGMGAIMPEPEYELTLNGSGDVAIYVLSRISGEGNDRDYIPGDVLLTETEQRDILALHRKYDKFLLVINAGGPVDLTPVLEVENILILSQLGVDTGTVLADLILGRAYPSGKLTTTWTSMENHPQIGDFGGTDDTRYREGIYVGYRYFDTVGTKPLFPFGFGLSYTSFEVSNAHMTAEGQRVCVSTTVKNAGARPGKETILDFLPAPLALLGRLMSSKPKKGAEILHQYATAIPIGTAVAQSWNRELAYICGYQGIVMTDWLVAGGYLSRNPKYPAPKASNVAAAGGDLVMPGGKCDYKDILAALKTGKLSRTQLEINATRVLRITKLLKG